MKNENNNEKKKLFKGNGRLYHGNVFGGSFVRLWVK